MFGLLFYAKSHILATQTYFEQRNLKVIEIRKPSADDWTSNPFNEKNKTWLGQNFRPFDFRLVDHKLVLVANQDRTAFELYWRQVSAHMFGGGNIHFKKAGTLSDQKLKNYLPAMVRVKEQCPACGAKITTKEQACLACGIRFEG